MRFKNHWGQNFLVSAAAREVIIKALELDQQDVVIDMGAGLGALTDSLAEKCARVIAVEKDPELASFLKQSITDEKVQVVQADMRQLIGCPRQLRASFDLPNKYKIVGNLPYYLTSFFIGKLILLEPLPLVTVLTLQDEVAGRIAAQPPRSRLLSVLVQSRMKVELLGRLAPSQFFPQPAVFSQIIRLVPHNEWNRADFALLIKLARVGFLAPRKQILNNFIRSFGKMNRQRFTNLFTEAGIAPSRRAETLTLQEWQKLVQLWKKHLAGLGISMVR